MTVIRRLLVLTTLIFWVGGFTFYAAVVVPVGAEVLGSHRDQGNITRFVTNYLNMAATAALPFLAWDVAAARDPARWRRLVRWLAWLGMVVTLAALVAIHPRLDALIPESDSQDIPRAVFRPLHLLYLWTSTVQWGCAVVYTALAVWAWHVADGGRAGDAA